MGYANISSTCQVQHLTLDSQPPSHKFMHPPLKREGVTINVYEFLKSCRLAGVLPVDIVYTWVNGTDPKLLQGLREVTRTLNHTCPLSHCLAAPFITILYAFHIHCNIFFPRLGVILLGI